MTTFSRSVVALALLASGMLLLAGCGGNVPAPTSYTRYNADDGSFACDCPDGWSCEGGGKGFQWAEFSSGGASVEIETGKQGSMMGEVIAAQQAGADPTQIDESMTPVALVHDAEREGFARERTDYEEQPATTVKSKMGDVRKSEFTETGALGGKVHGYRATALGHNDRIQIVCTCSESNWATLQPAFDAMIASLGPGKKKR